MRRGDGADVQADANPGYTFLNWTENGNVVSARREVYLHHQHQPDARRELLLLRQCDH
jgi:hypothetical protein